MGELSFVKSASFGEVPCDFYGGENDVWMTREQIGAALEYSEPRVAISKIHTRKKERLDKFSTVTRLVTVDGKEREIMLYNRKGIMEICRHSGQPKADAFIDFCWEIMDDLLSGEAKNASMDSCRQQNIQLQRAQLLNQIAEEYDGTYKQILQAYVTKELTGQFLLPLPSLKEKTYSATEIGEKLGISATKVGILANQYGLKNEEYGEWFKDKSPHSKKEVSTFRYYEKVLPVLREFASI